VSDDRKDLIEARRVISMMVRVARQTQAYFEGISVMDKNRVQKALRDAVRESERYLNKV
jgi:hypothetical protein